MRSSEKNNSNGVSGGGIGFVGLLQIAFIVLKLVGVIDWKWVFVLLPTIISAGIVILLLLLMLLIVIIRINI